MRASLARGSEPQEHDPEGGGAGAPAGGLWDPGQRLRGPKKESDVTRCELLLFYSGKG